MTSKHNINLHIGLLIISLVIIIIIGLADGWVTYYWDSKIRFIFLFILFTLPTYAILLLSYNLVWKRNINLLLKLFVTIVAVVAAIISAQIFQFQMKHSKWDKSEGIICYIIYLGVILASYYLFQNKSEMKVDQEIIDLRKNIEIQKLKNELNELKKVDKK